MSEILVREIAAVVEQELDVQEKAWDEARLMIDFHFDDGRAGGVMTCLYRSQGQMSGILLDPEKPNVTTTLRSELEAETGRPVMRIRIALSGLGATPELDYFHDVSEGTVDWVWPDEPGYSGRAFQPSPGIVRQDSWEHSLVAGSVGEPSDSVARIRGWLEGNAPAHAALLNPPATPEALSAFEEKLGVVLPASVREAWLVHDGQSRQGMGVLRYEDWLSMSDSLEQMSWFRDRPDGGEGMIPVIESDGDIGYVESVGAVGEDGPLWRWEIEERREMKVADSFGEYLAWLAGASERDEILLFEGSLAHRDEI